jgi:hypothetical protein
MYIYIVHISVKAPSSEPQNQRFNYKTRAITLHKTSCRQHVHTHTHARARIHTFIHTYVRTYIHTCISENYLFSTEAARGCGRVWHVFSTLIGMFDLILCKILVDVSHPFAPLWLRVCVRYPRRCSILHGNWCLSSALELTTAGLLEMLVHNYIVTNVWAE